MADWQVACLGPAVWPLAAGQADAGQADAGQTGRLGQWSDRLNGWFA